ncbi:MAG: flagellar biosynthesis anti-sigma factor FlgM [Rhodoferax ferrireducens]|uniref:Negative regulator of flagellin synthesis n=1 Tax=Rhodoferax ferrireducens TaxID=192843 RepID=A0A1W9KRH8_9BURK|nr:MAG: flagellar biosynthesis anti-sigma factor FlgM [Rhodoferax ferrireducens]
MTIIKPSDNHVALTSNAAPLAAKSAPAASAQAKTSAAKGPQTAGVAVTVSSLARSMETEGASELAEVDMVKVNSVKQSIANGTFVVNPGVIADKLLSNAQDMLQRTRI